MHDDGIITISLDIVFRYDDLFLLVLVFLIVCCFGWRYMLIDINIDWSKGNERCRQQGQVATYWHKDVLPRHFQYPGKLQYPLIYGKSPLKYNSWKCQVGSLRNWKEVEFYRQPMAGSSGVNMKVDKGLMTPLGHDTQGIKKLLQISWHQDWIFHNKKTRITEFGWQLCQFSKLNNNWTRPFPGRLLFLRVQVCSLTINFVNKDDNDPGWEKRFHDPSWSRYPGKHAMCSEILRLSI